MKNKLYWFAWLGVLICVVGLATMASAATETTAETTETITGTVQDTVQESTSVNTIPQVSWWAKLLAGIGLGPLVAIAGAVVALLTSAVVIVIVHARDRRKCRMPRTKE